MDCLHSNNTRLYVATSSTECLCLMLETYPEAEAEGEHWWQFFSDVQGHRQSLKKTPFETGHHRGGRSRRVTPASPGG